jgi:holo-[acyl-carrier protein] synthase
LIIGSGVDLMPVDRIERESARRGGDAFDDVFTASELEWCRHRRHPARAYAAGFAAKEACVKALGTGLTGRMNWKDMEVGWAADGRPAMRLDGETAATAEALGVQRIHLSVTVTKRQAVAVVILEGVRRLHS